MCDVILVDPDSVDYEQLLSAKELPNVWGGIADKGNFINPNTSRK